MAISRYLVQESSAGNVVGGVVLVRSSIDDANGRIGEPGREPIGLGQQLRMGVATLTDGKRGHGPFRSVWGTEVTMESVDGSGPLHGVAVWPMDGDLRDRYRPSNLGSRFSTKERTPSRRSSDSVTKGSAISDHCSALSKSIVEVL